MGLSCLDRRSLLVFAIVLLTEATVRGDWKTDEPLICEGNFYYDHGTGHCEHCRDICEYAAIQRTQEACETQCPQYLAAKSCKGDEYYDDNVKNCAPCSELCSDDEDQCREKCKVYYLGQQEPKRKEIASLHSSDVMKAPDASKDKTSSDSALTTLHPGYIVAICAIAFVVVFSITFFVVFKRCNGPYKQAPQNDLEAAAGQRNGKRPVEETSQASGHSPIYVPNRHSRQPIMHVTAYSDLPTRHSDI